MEEYMDKLFQNDVRSRVLAAREYSVLPDRSEPPQQFWPEWSRVLKGRKASDGKEWPPELVRVCNEVVWPSYAFGAANASILVLWHRPELGGGQIVDGIRMEPFIKPHTPNLGGISNP